jgi:hypothetical protein
MLYQTASGLKSVTDPDEYYDILSKSPNTNSALVKGGKNSLKHLYEDVFKNDALECWAGMDVTMVGCDYGLLTAYNAIYCQSGENSVFGGMLYNKEGDYGAPDFSTNGEGRFPYVNIPYAHHINIASDPRAMEVINDLILGKKVKDYSDTLPDGILVTSSIKRSVGMSDMIRVELKSQDPLVPTLTNAGLCVKIYDKRGNVVAFSNGERQSGFGINNFIFFSWETVDHSTNILCYIPKEGYTMEVLSGSLVSLKSNVTVYTQTLDQSGAILSRNGYNIAGASPLSGSIFTLDAGKSMTPSPKVGAKLTELSAEVYKQNWRFASGSLSLRRNQASALPVVGEDVSSMAAENYSWESSDPDVATVSADGVITAKSPGTAIITATAQDESFKIESVTVTVDP